MSGDAQPLPPKLRADVAKAFLSVAPQLIASIVIPLTVAGMGWYYTRWQQNVADLKTMIDLVTDADREKRKYGVAMFEYLLKNDKVPVEFVYAQLNFANTVADKDLLSLFEIAIQKAGQENPKVLATYAEALGRLPSRVFLHVNSDAERRCVETALAQLKDADRAKLTISGTIAVTNYVNPVNELRFLKPEDAATAQAIADIFGSLGVPSTVKDVTAWGATARFVRPNTFELWIGDVGVPGCVSRSPVPSAAPGAKAP